MTVAAYKAIYLAIIFFLLSRSLLKGDGFDMPASRGERRWVKPFKHRCLNVIVSMEAPVN